MFESIRTIYILSNSYIILHFVRSHENNNYTCEIIILITKRVYSLEIIKNGVK